MRRGSDFSNEVSADRTHARRIFTRFAAFLACLALVDIAIGAAWPAVDFEDDWRMPRSLPTSELPAFVDHVEASSGAGEPVIAFVGASPAWGDAVKDRHDTVPAAFERVTTQRLGETRVYNLACNGQLLGDEYFVAQRVADDADLLIVQLTYHGFNRVWREDATSRFPELPALLGVRVDRNLAGVLGREESARLDVTGAFDRWLGRHWRLYGSRDAIAGRLLGGTPEKRLFETWQKVTLPDFLGEQERVPSGLAFDELSPDEQMLVIDEFSAAGEYVLDPADSQVRVLERLAGDLEKAGVRTVFYISPLNVEALESFDLFDRAAYEENVRPLRAIVESHGHRFIDMNSDSNIPSSAFADVNHTTAAGNRLVADELWVRTAGLLEAAEAR